MLRMITLRVLADREFIAAFVIGAVLVVSEIVPSFWALVTRYIGLGGLAAGIVLYAYFQHLKPARLMQKEKAVPILFAVDVPRSDAENNFEELKQAISHRFNAFKEVERHFNVRYHYLIAHHPDRLRPDVTDWEKFLANSQQDIRQFLGSVPGPRVYHTAVRGPSALALGVGALIGIRSPVVVYHHTGNHYVPVIDLSQQDPGILKSPAQEESGQKFIRVTFPDTLQEDVAVVLNMARNDPRGDTEAYLSAWEQKPSIVTISNTYGGTLPLGDWIPVVQELHQVFSRLQANPVVSNIHVFLAMPPPLALGLGMALGTYVNVTVYNWESDMIHTYPRPYYPVLKLNQLRSIL